MFKLKKVLLFVALAFVGIVATACKPQEKFDVDGVFTAFSPEIHADGPQVTMVSVTIENGKVKSYFIDCVQNTKTLTDGKATFAFKEKSKKELGYEYGMHNPKEGAFDLSTEAGIEAYKLYLKENNKLEWFEQAQLIEKAFLKKGVDKITKTEGNVIDNVAKVTIKDGNYIALAKEALQLARDGKTHVVTTSKTDLVWVTATLNEEGKFASLELNTLQGKVTDNKFAWNEENKQQLGYKYGMHNPRTGGYDLKTAEGLTAYKQYLKDNNKLEWFEQVKLITDFVLANGVDALKVEKDKVAGVDALTTVTIKVGTYQKVLTELYDNFK